MHARKQYHICTTAESTNTSCYPPKQLHSINKEDFHIVTKCNSLKLTHCNK